MVLAWNPEIAKSFAWSSFCAKVHGYLGISVVWIKVMKARALTTSFLTFARHAVLVTWILFVFHYLFIYFQRNLQLLILLSNGKDLASCRTFFRGIDGVITSSLEEQFTVQVTVVKIYQFSPCSWKTDFDTVTLIFCKAPTDSKNLIS